MTGTTFNLTVKKAVFTLMLFIIFPGMSMALDQPSTSSQTLNDTAYFPAINSADWQEVKPEQVGWDTAQLNSAMDYALTEKTKGLLILLNGRILFEGYAKRWHKNKSARIFSATKSMLSVLIAIAQQQQLLHINDPVSKHLGKGWSEAKPNQESKILIKHLLAMTSGLTKKLSYQHPAGKVWFYNNEAYYLLFKVLEKASGESRTEFSSQYLFEPIGMNHTKYPLGNISVRVSASTRDMGRFGLLMLNRGNWDGSPMLLDQNLLSQMLAPQQQHNPSYGLLWWLNSGKSFQFPGSDHQFQGKILPHLPDDTFMALGHGSKIILMVPSLKLVIARQGKPTKNKSFMRVLTEKIISAAPANLTNN